MSARAALACLALACWIPLSGCSEGSSGSSWGGGGAEAEAAAVAALLDTSPGGTPWYDDAFVTPPDLRGESQLHDDAPWQGLGPLTGAWSVTVELLDSDCVLEPQLSPRVGWIATHRGDWMSFAWEEGIGFAQVEPSPTGPVLARIERWGTDGVLRTEGLATVLLGPEARRAFDAVLDYTFEPSVDYAAWHALQGLEACSGQLRLTGEQASLQPEPGARDFHFVLRWPAAHAVDLDLILALPEGDPSPFGSARSFAQRHVDFALAQRGCHVIASTGRLLAGGAPGEDVEGRFVRSLADEADGGLAHHEEILRCSAAPLGLHTLRVVRWDGDATPVPFELEAFMGTRVVSGGRENTSFGVLHHEIAPQSVNEYGFLIEPSTQPPGSGAVNVVVGGYLGLRPYGFLTDSWLEFHRAAYEELSYAEFVDALP